LATRIFDVVTRPENVAPKAKALLSELSSSDTVAYWRRVLRMAALCHDMGHLPFSHAAEFLLPEGTTHETISAAIIRSDAMKNIWNAMTPPLRADDVVKLALGPKEAKGMQFSAWQAILAEIIVGDAFGADRMDYLLRDSYHAGVAYGRFDHYRLIDTLRILPSPPREKNVGGDGAESGVELGVEHGGLHSAEALMLARYFMYSQLYYHCVRRIYNVHLADFLTNWLPGGKFTTAVDAFLKLSDNEVNAAIGEAARNKNKKGHDAARRIVTRDHFRLVYERNPEDVKINPEAGKAVYAALVKELGKGTVHHDFLPPKGGAPEFPIRMNDGRIASSAAVSETLSKLPVPSVDFVFADNTVAAAARDFIEKSRNDILNVEEN